MLNSQRVFDDSKEAVCIDLYSRNKLKINYQAYDKSSAFIMYFNDLQRLWKFFHADSYTIRSN
jgi:hypothetical protein